MADFQVDIVADATAVDVSADVAPAVVAAAEGSLFGVTVPVLAVDYGFSVEIPAPVLSVTAGGDLPGAVLVSGPAGPQGPKGDTGDVGPAGVKGDQGDPGAVGATGPTGPTGDTGPQGPQGETGPQGPAGADGAAGAAGADGYTPPAIALWPTGSTSFGNGLDGRMPAVSTSATALGGAYFAGINGPWTSVDVYLAWMEYPSTTAGNIYINWYFKTVADGESIGKSAIGYQTIASSGTNYMYHESLIGSDVAVDPEQMITAAVARYATNAADTHEATVGFVALIIKPH